MTKQLYIFTIGAFCTHLLYGQANMGTRLTAMGNNGTAVRDLWGVAANPASFTGISYPTVQLSHQQNFFVKELSNQSLALALPANRQVFGLNLERYGLSEFQNIQIGIVTNRQFGPKLSIGLRAKYHQLSIQNYGNTVGFSIDIGTLYQLTEEICLGFYLTNPSKEKYGAKSIDLHIPTTTHAGIAYRTSEKLLLASTVSEDFFAIGLDYQLIKPISLRSGISLNPFTHYAGIGFSSLKFLADFTFRKHPDLGYSPQFAFGYVF